MAEIHYDRAAWPVVIATIEGTPDDGDLERFIRENWSDLERQEPYVLVLDVRRIGGVNPKLRRRLAEFISANETILRRYRAGVAYVLDSSLTRGVLTAIYWLKPPPYRYDFFKTVDDAKAWGTRCVAQHAAA